MDILPPSGAIATDCPQHLHLETEATDLKVFRSGYGERYGTYKATFNYENYAYAPLHTSWDIDPSTVRTVKGILLFPTAQRKLEFIPRSGYLLLLQPHGDYFERVGFAWFTRGVLEDDTYHDPEYHECEFRDKGCVYWMLSSRCFPRTAWWSEGTFTKETIMLG